MSSRRRKNPHPKRAVNARTVLKGEKELLSSSFSARDAKCDFECMSRRRKNPHPKRAVNARTVLKAREKEEPNLVLCLKIPDEDEVVFEVEQKEIRKETTTTKRGKRKRGHECDVCEKRFSRAGYLKIHMCTHTNEKPYECDVCEKCFRQSQHLKIHMRIHTNEKQYECHVCEKRYRHANSLKYHVRTQH